MDYTVTVGTVEYFNVEEKKKIISDFVTKV